MSFLPRAGVVHRPDSSRNCNASPGMSISFRANPLQTLESRKHADSDAEKHGAVGETGFGASRLHSQRLMSLYFGCPSN